MLALSYPHFWGVDGGASILTVNAVLGDEPTGAGFPKPPLAPGLLLAPFILLGGPDIGYKVWSALFAVFPLVPIYLLTRQIISHRWMPLLAIIFAAVDWMWGEMFVTGAHPLPAFALLGMAFWAMGEIAKPFLPSWRGWKKFNISNEPRTIPLHLILHKRIKRLNLRNSIILAVSIGLIPWINQTTAGITIIVLPVYFLALLAFSNSRRDLLWRTLPLCFVGGIMGAAALPWYMQTLPGSEILTYQGPTLYWAWGTNTFQSFIIALPIGVFALWKGPAPHIRALGAVLIVLGVMVNFLSFDEVLINPLYRARYFMTMLVYPLIFWIAGTYCLPRVNCRLATVFAIIAFIYMGSVFVYSVRLQNEYSLMVSQDTAEALELINGKATATNSFTLSLWVAGLKKVKSPFLTTAPPPPAYQESDPHLRCVFGWVSMDDGCNGPDSAQVLGIRYLLVEERFPYYNQHAPGNYLAPPDQWRRTAEAPWLDLVYSKGTTRLWQIKDGSESRYVEKAQSR